MSATPDLAPSPASSRRPLRRAAPDGLLAATLLAFLASAGLFYVNIMAALVAGLVDGLQLPQRTAGLAASANVYGAAVGAFAAVLIVRRVHWRPVAVALLVALIAADLLSMLVRDGTVLIGVRFAHGMIGGLLVGVGFAVIARTRIPDRAFGMLLVVQFGLGGLGTMTLPRLVPHFGHEVLFLALVAFSVVTLVMVPFLDDYPAGRVPRAVPHESGVRWGYLALTLAAVFLFQAGNMGLGAYLIGLARTAGLDTGYAASAIGVATWLGIAGSVFVVIVGTRFGRALPLAVAMALALVGNAAFHWSDSQAVYALANVVGACSWACVISYLLGMSAEFDAAGRTAALGGFVSKLGLASGPFIGAQIVGAQDVGPEEYGRLINVAVVVLALSIPAMLWPAVRLDRARRS